MKNLSIEEISNLINAAMPDTYFLVPADIFGHAAKHAAQYAAASILKKYNHHWKIQDQTTTFDVYGEEKQEVWIPSAQEWQTKNVIKISMTNDKLAEFAANMNTIND